MATPSNTPGNLSLGPIPQLPDSWWTGLPPNNPASVWTVWDPNTFYLWGANSGNYKGIAIGQSLRGDGMAGPHGPSRGMAHPHYVGIITMDKGDLSLNDPVFATLASNIAKGQNVVSPTFKGEWSFGTGIGKGVPHWGDIQKYVLKQVYLLGKSAGSVTIPSGSYWPDYRPGQHGKQHPIHQLDDLLKLSDML